EGSTPGPAPGLAPEPAPGVPPEGEAPPAEPAAPPEPAAPSDATPAPDALGAHLADPLWFRKTMFGDKGKVLDTKRSTADEQGRFSSLLRFELADTTVEQCAEQIQGLVGSEITSLQREAKPNGRVQLKGNTERYEATFVCGSAEGKTIAYVSYSWT
ncbi:MAG: hypothetical protein KDK70_03675, partial [Myxococcales bacterium]|nr:hypothetical protein [Myxococcales bacterium]